MVERLRVLAAALALIAGAASAAEGVLLETPLSTAWATATLGASTPIRGITIGPIESSLHPGKGYGSSAYVRALDEARRMGATWVSLTPFGRLWDLEPTGVDPTFEAPHEQNVRDIGVAIDQAHARGLRVLLVPHLWVETGGWRALLDPGDSLAWERFVESYARFGEGWARVAHAHGVDLLSVGVELRNWVTTTHAKTFSDVIRRVRRIYSGPVTYAANWDDVEDTVVLGELDVIAINAFYPLADAPGADPAKLRQGGERVAEGIARLSRSWRKPVLLAEIGYTTRPDPAVRPWEWPDTMTDVTVDQHAQADAYEALLAPLLAQPAVAGFFVWRLYADPDDLSQEAEWGFSPRGKLAELVMRDAFRARWASDGPTRALPARRAERVAVY